VWCLWDVSELCASETVLPAILRHDGAFGFKCRPVRLKKRRRACKPIFSIDTWKVPVIRGSWLPHESMWSQFGPILSLWNGSVPLSSSKAIALHLSKVITAHVMITVRSSSYQIYAKTHALLLKYLHGSQGLSDIKHVEYHSSTFYLCMDNRLLDKCTLEFSQRKLTFMPL